MFDGVDVFIGWDGCFGEEFFGGFIVIGVLMGRLLLLPCVGSSFFFCRFLIVVLSAMWVVVLVSGIVVVLEMNGMVLLVFGLVFRM